MGRRLSFRVESGAAIFFCQYVASGAGWGALVQVQVAGK